MKTKQTELDEFLEKYFDGKYGEELISPKND